MAGEIASAYLAVVPSMKGFGQGIVSQAGPQMNRAAAQLGSQGGAVLGRNLGGAAAQASVPALSQVNSAVQQAAASSSEWLTQTAAMAVKNVTLYGSMYFAIRSIQSAMSSAWDAMVGFNGELEQASIGFETLLGSASAAQEQMQWIQQFAKETPFQYDNLVRYSQQLLALGFNSELAREVLQATGDAAAALGRGDESIARINLALGQMWTKGKVQSQEMLQLTEAGIGAWQILADAYGTSVAKVQDAVTKGLVSASEAVPVLLEGMNARFGGLMERQSQTYAGMLSNIQDTLKQQLAEAGEPLFRELTVQAEKLLDALNDPEVLKMFSDLGKALAAGTKFLTDMAWAAWAVRDALVAIGVGVVAAKLLARIPVGSFMHAGTIQAAATAQRAYAAGLSRTSALLAGVSQLGLGRFAGIGQIAGLAAVTDGLFRVAEAGEDAGQATLGFLETVGGATVAGAAFGSVIPGVGTAVGAATGAVLGLTTSLWSMQAAMDAANADTSVAQEALRNLGVEANLAKLALSGITNEQLAAVGGFSAIADAMREGQFSEFVAGVQDQIDALREQQDALKGSKEGVGELYQEWWELQDQAEALESALAALGVNGEYWAQSQEQIVASGYAAAFAMDMQTGSLGALSEAAWQAVIAEGGLGAEALAAAARMEGLAGVAGYATEMISGIPKGTPINFTTNAADILGQIIALQAAAEASFSSLGMTADGFARRMAQLQSQYEAALRSSSVSLSLPGSSSRPSSGAASAVKAAASKAAQKLARDKQAQLRFADAFHSLMESALAGNFDQFRDRLADQIEQLTRDGYKKAAARLKELSGTLTTAALDYANLTKKIEVASDAYEVLTGRMTDQYNASRDLVLGLGQITDAQSFDQLAYLLGETTSKANEYQSILQQLKAQGLAEDLWNQLAGAGPESLSLAQSILAQGQDGIEQLNSLSAGLLDAADSMGTLVSESMYRQGVDAMKAYIDGLLSGKDALEAQLQQIANNVLTSTAGAITPKNAGYSLLDFLTPKQTTNQITVTVPVEKLGDLKSIEEFIAMLNNAATSQLVNEAGTVVG